MLPEFSTDACPICGKKLAAPNRNAFGTLSCPNCSAKLWFMAYSRSANFFDFESSSQHRSNLRQLLANQLGVSPTKFPPDLCGIKLDDLGLDSLDTVELVMELEEEFNYKPPNDDDPPTAVV